ncbi:MAG: hypothetical protein GDA56_29120 [Hormoscilla sp. GM7CHS1pb]|nr:hypothetical protein [Hormoscilla sp. GM7CHS1pb]
MGGWIGKRSGAPAMSAHPCRARVRHDRVGISGNGPLNNHPMAGVIYSMAEKNHSMTQISHPMAMKNYRMAD